MKKFLAALIFIAIGYAGTGQNYADSTITLQLTQLSSVYVSYFVKNNIGDVWQNRLSPGTLKPYVGSGANLDSLFTVTLKASFINGMIDLLLTGQNQVVQADRQKIISNSPSIPDYTALATQITTKSNGNTSEKNVATYILNYYNTKVAQLDAVRASIINQVVQWTQN